MSCFNFPSPPAPDEVVFNTDNHQHYRFNAAIGAWETIQIALDPVYVNRTGDEMTGTIEIDDPTKITEDNELINKGYVDLRMQEIEQEIDGIAPSVQRGQWKYTNAVGSGDPGSGYFYLRNATDTNTNEYEKAVSVVFSNTDALGASHGWTEATLLEDLIQLADLPDGHGLMGQITKVENFTGYVIISFDFITGDGTAEQDELTRLNIFEAPTGGDLDAYLPLVGGEMTGDIKFKPPSSSKRLGIRPSEVGRSVGILGYSSDVGIVSYNNAINCDATTLFHSDIKISSSGSRIKLHPLDNSNPPQPTAGQQGQVLTSGGPNNPPYWGSGGDGFVFSGTDYIKISFSSNTFFIEKLSNRPT